MYLKVDRLCGLKDLKRPTSKTQVCKLYDLLSYYRKFIRVFSRKCKLISTLMKGEEEIKWIVESENALNLLLHKIAVSDLAMPVYD